jgi:tryptophanyl-tRNA synthetase
MKEHVLTGITTTGTPHLGNYVGAIRPAVAASRRDDVQSFYFLADYHALVKNQDPEAIHRSSLEVAATWLALGLDTRKAIFYRQTDIPEILELTWILTSVTAKGLMNRAHAYKAAVQDNEQTGSPDPDRGITMALYCYPILMAADILLFKTNRVPVGQDQKQHVEVTRDIAIKFNEAYGETFVIPDPQIRGETARVPGTDGEKMSKSWGNTIEIFGDEKVLRKKIMGIKMDSRTPQEPKPDADQNLAIILMKLVASPDIAQTFEDRLRTGGLGYGDLKKALFEHYWNHFADARARRAELQQNLDYVHGVLKEGARRARAVAAVVLDRAKKNCGLV